MVTTLHPTMLAVSSTASLIGDFEVIRGFNHKWYNKQRQVILAGHKEGSDCMMCKGLLKGIEPSVTNCSHNLLSRRDW